MSLNKPDNIDQQRTHTKSIHHEENEYDDSTTETQHTIIVVGLYIGATVSGSAFCYNREGHWSQIQMNKSWVNEFGITSTTIPTAVAWAQNVKSASDYHFGHDAIIAYTKALKSNEISLLETHNLNFKKNIADDSDKTVLGFLEITISKLKESVELQLKNNKLLTNKGDIPIKWIVTHANVMKHDLTKEFLQKVIQSSDVDVISEDKAAGLWCAEMPIYELTAKEDPSLTNGTFYCVIDVESQYFSIFKKKDTMLVDTLATQSFTLDLPGKYEQLLCEVFERTGKPQISQYKQEHSRDWFITLKNLQTQMNGFVHSKEMQISISLPVSFVKFFKHVKEHKTNSVYYTDYGKLVIKPSYFNDIFDSCAAKILYYLDGLSNNTSYPISFLFLIGKATLLRRPISRYINDKSSDEKPFPKVTIQEIKEPEDSGACALKGAVLVGRVISSRMQYI